MNFLTAIWENIVMANYVCPPEILIPFLPHGCTLDFYEGKAYVSLVGFMFRKTRIFGVPIPVVGTFEEVNLRFYVVRQEGGVIKRGVVFINETVPDKLVAFVANLLYKEHYIAIPTKHAFTQEEFSCNLQYQWQKNKVWNKIQVKAQLEKQDILKGSIEEFIFEHYYGYTKINNRTTEEYEVIHPRWQVKVVDSFDIKCRFDEMYGQEFAFLNNQSPATVLLSEGSSVSVKWKRKRLSV